MLSQRPLHSRRFILVEDPSLDRLVNRLIEGWKVLLALGILDQLFQLLLCLFVFRRPLATLPQVFGGAF